MTLTPFSLSLYRRKVLSLYGYSFGAERQMTVTFRPCAVKAVLMTVYSAILLNAASLAEAKELRPRLSRSIVEASICDLVTHPRQFRGKMVSVHADFETDGFENWSLTDPACSMFGVKPSGGSVFDPVIGVALLEALHHGCAGTRDKRISGTWQGVYHWQPPGSAKPGMLYRWLVVLRIKDVAVVPIQGGPSCPSRP